MKRGRTMQPTFAGIDKSGETKSSLTSKMGVVFQVVAQPAVCNVLLFSLITSMVEMVTNIRTRI